MLCPILAGLAGAAALEASVALVGPRHCYRSRLFEGGRSPQASPFCWTAQRYYDHLTLQSCLQALTTTSQLPLSSPIFLPSSVSLWP